MQYTMPSKEKLLKLQKRYKTDKAIGDSYGVSRQAVYRWRLRHGIRSLRELTEARNYLIKKDRKSGISIAKLVKKYKLSVSHIYRVS